MPSYKAAFGSFLKTDDLQGKAIKAVIESVGIEEIKSDDGKEKKLVARFLNKDKGLILNRTNCEALEEMFSTDDYDSWVGHTIVLFPTTTKMAGKTVPCLRVRAPQVAAPPPPPPVREPGEDDVDDSVGF